MILLLIAALANAAPQPGDLKLFGDWTVACDNVRSCHATALMPEDGNWDKRAGMSIKRDGGANAAVAIAVFGEGQTARLRADGKALDLRFVPTEEEYRVEPADTPRLLAAIRSARNIIIEDSKGTEIGELSLAGVSAALLYMDDQQKRVGTRTALVRPGTRDASAVPPLPKVPSVRSAAGPGKAIIVDAARIEAIRKVHACVPEEKDWPGYESFHEVLDAQHSLLLLGCGAGAYNYSSVPFIVSRRGGEIAVELAKFDLPPRWTGDEGKPVLVNAGWDLGTGLLTSFSKGRGIGDCGIGSDYGWDGERFRLVHQIEMGECRGSVDYITTWRAELVKR